MARFLEVNVSGLPEVRRALRRIEGDLPGVLQSASKRVAQMIVADAKARVPIGPPANGHVRSSYKATPSRSGYAVRAGGAKYLYLPWLEFGGRVGRRHAVRRKRIKEGRYLWVALANKRSEIYGVMRDELGDVARRAR